MFKLLNQFYSEGEKILLKEEKKSESFCQKQPSNESVELSFISNSHFYFTLKLISWDTNLFQINRIFSPFLVNLCIKSQPVSNRQQPYSVLSDIHTAHAASKHGRAALTPHTPGIMNIQYVTQLQYIHHLFYSKDNKCFLIAISIT